MINILIVHPTLSPPFGRGGVETVLISYLNILSKFVTQEKCKVDLLLLKEITEDELAIIPQNINTTFNFRGLSVFEEMFQIYCSIERNKGHYSISEKKFFSSWDDQITDYCNKNILNVINSGNHDIIINFDSHFDDFLKKYDITNQLPIIRWIHSDTHFTTWKNNPDLYKYLLNKHSYLVNICNEMSEKCSQILPELGVDKPIVTLVNPIDEKDIKEKLSIQEKEITENDKILISENYILQVARLFDYGAGPNYSKLEERIKELGLEGDCLLLGRRDNPYIFMKHAKLFIHTSLSEGLPTVFLESMVCGTPVVAMDCPTGPRDILGNGEFGALIPLGNKTEFVNRVYALLNNDIERNTYIHRLPESIARFNIDRVSNELEKLLVRVSESVKQ